MWETLLGSAVTPAIQAGAGEGAIQAVTPALTDEAINAGITATLGNTLGNVGVNTLPTGLANGLPQGLGGGMFSSLGNFGSALGSDTASNIYQGLGGAYNMYNQGQSLDQAKNVQNKQLAMQQDVYNRDKSADERRQKLVF